MFRVTSIIYLIIIYLQRSKNYLQPCTKLKLSIRKNKQITCYTFCTRYRHVRSVLFLLFFSSRSWKPFKECFKTYPYLLRELFTFGWVEIDPLSHCTLWEHWADHSYENLIVSHANGSEIDVYRFHVNVSLQWRQPTVTRSFLSRLYVRVFFLPSMTARHTTLPNLRGEIRNAAIRHFFLSGLNDTCVE